MSNVFEYCINSSGQIENIIFTDLTLNGTNTKVYTGDELNKIMLTRHGEKKLCQYPNWVTYINKNDSECWKYWLKLCWNNYVNSNHYMLERIYDALSAEYNPIENTDKYSEHTEKHKGSDSIEKSGSEVNSKSGSDSNNRVIQSKDKDILTIDKLSENVKSGVETTVSDINSDNIKSGTEKNDTTITYDTTDKNTKSGSQNNEHSYTNLSNEHSEKPFNDTDRYIGVSKDVKAGSENEKTTYTNMSDTNTKTGNEKTVSNTSFGTGDNARKDTTTEKNTTTVTYGSADNERKDSIKDTGSETSDKTNDTTDKNTTTYDSQDTLTFNSRTDTTNYNSNIEYIEHTHGNIGITSNQSMVSAEIELRLNNQMLNLIIDDFASEICI